jgi:probable O-glycosylation ligase (exosortase A-associated)
MFMTVVTVAITDTFERLRLLVLVIAGSFAAFVLKSFPFMVATGGAYRLYGPDKSMITDNNDFGLALNMTLPLFFFLAQTESSRWVRRFFTFLSLITIPTIFFTYSRGALLGLLVVMGMMVLRLRQRIILIPLIVVGAVLALAFAPDAWKARMDPDRAIDASARERLNAWAFSRNLAADYPLTGGGFSTFTPELFARYAPVTGDIHGPHSVYFGVLAEHGAIGLALYLTLVLASFLTARGLVKEGQRRDDFMVVQYANMFRFSLVGFLTSGFFLGRAYFDYFFTIVACLAILRYVARKRWANETTELEDDDASFEFEPHALRGAVHGVS